MRNAPSCFFYTCAQLGATTGLHRLATCLFGLAPCALERHDRVTWARDRCAYVRELSSRMSRSGYFGSRFTLSGSWPVCWAWCSNCPVQAGLLYLLSWAAEDTCRFEPAPRLSARIMPLAVGFVGCVVCLYGVRLRPGGGCLRFFRCMPRVSMSKGVCPCGNRLLQPKGAVLGFATLRGCGRCPRQRRLRRVARPSLTRREPTCRPSRS